MLRALGVRTSLGGRAKAARQDALFWGVVFDFRGSRCFSPPMKIFVVGGAGYIGSVCSEWLLNEGHEVAIFDNLTEGHRQAVDSRANFIQGDLADRRQIDAAISSSRPDALMHFAANALVGESMQNPSKYFRNNVCNGLNLLDAMVAAGGVCAFFLSHYPNLGSPGPVAIQENERTRRANHSY